MKMLKQTLLVASVGLALGSGASFAGPEWADGLNNIEFQDFENIYRQTANCTPTTCLPFDVNNDPTGWQRVAPTGNDNLQQGDVFAGIFQVREITDSGGTSQWDKDAGSDEFSGYFVQEVANIIFSESGDIDHVNLTTAATDPFGVLSAGEMIGFWVDDGAGVTEFSSNTTTFQDILNATDGGNGELFATFGLSAAGAISGGPAALDPDVTDGYIYSHVDLSNNLANFGDQDGFGGFNLLSTGTAYNLGELQGINDFSENEISGEAVSPISGLCVPNPLDPTPDQLTCNQLVGNFQLEVNQNSSVATGGIGTSPWIFESQDPLQLFTVAIPEPASIALLGLGLIGLGGMRHRQNKA